MILGKIMVLIKTDSYSSTLEGFKRSHRSQIFAREQASPTAL